MKDNEIIKALEYCANVKSCNECNKPTQKPCTVLETKHIFDLINRQKTEIFELKKQVEHFQLKNSELFKLNNKIVEENGYKDAEIERLKNLVETMSDYFPACINCEGKTPLGERTDKCVYLNDDTEYCTKRGIENIAHIVKENKSQKAEIDRLRHILVNFMGEIFDWGNKNGVDTKIFAQTAILGKEKDGAVKQIKSEAYREFAERFKYFVLHEDIEIVDCKCTDYQNYVNGANQFRHQVKNGIDNTLKELTRNLHGTCTETTDQTATNHSVSLIDGHIEE